MIADASLGARGDLGVKAMRSEGRSLMFGIAGERLAPMGDLSALIERVVPWP
jgi:hypothetical protein